MTRKEKINIIAYFFQSYKKQTLFVLILMMVSGLLESLNLAALYPIINYGLALPTTSKTLYVIEWLVGSLGIPNQLVASCVFLGVVTFLATGFKIFYNSCANELTQKIVSDHQKAIFNRYRQAQYAFFVNHQQGQLIYAGTISPIGVSNVIIYALRIANNLITSLFFSFLLILLAWQGTLLILLIGLFYVFFIKKTTSLVITQASHLLVEEDRKKNIILNEFITGIKTIRAYLSLDSWEKKYARAVDQSAHYGLRVMMGKMLPENFLKFTFFMIIAVGGLFLSTKSSQNILTMLPILATFAMVASRLFPYLNLVGNDVVAIARFMPDMKIVYDTLHKDITPQADGSKKLAQFKETIRFEKVSFQYPQMEEWILKDVSFSIPKRKITAIVGPSGSGKSTLIHLLLRLYDAERGVVSIDNVDIREYTLASYLGLIGYVSQETFVFNSTIRDNIAFGLENISDEQIIQAAQTANAHDFIIQCPEGYATIVGDAGTKLSGGQRQRIAIARAIVRNPQLIILDEATSALDNISEKVIQEAIQKIAKQTTVLIIAHRLSTIQQADNIIVIEKGVIQEEGTHEALLHREKAYYSLYKKN